MSFGFGVGDFLAVIELANKIRKRFSDAPTKLQDISKEVKGLSILLSDVEVYADTVVEKLGPSKAEELKRIVNGAKHVLQDLDNLLTRYETLSPNPGSSEKHRVKRLWERLMFDPGDISDLRARLTSSVSILESFLARITEQTTQKSFTRLEKQIDEQQQKQVLDWISNDCDRHTDRLNWLLGSREPGTRKWLFDSSEWRTWTSDLGRGTTLFCPGIPGAGKTHASAMVIERLYTLVPSDEIGIAFVFCDYQRADEKEHVGLVRNLLRMVLEQPHAWPAAVHRAYESSKRSKSEIGLDKVFDLLKASMRLRTRYFVVIDAMDELHQEARDVLIPRLFELQQSTGLNIFITSRDIAQISDLFSGTPRLKIKATGEDIEQYVSTYMATLPNFVSRNTALQNEIKESVVQASGEIFLLADLHLRSLKAKSSPKALRKALKSFSSGPDSTKEALENAMRRVTSQPEDMTNMALKTLMILTTTRRPLAVDELCHALAIDLDDLEDGFDEENIPPIDYVLSACAGLVIIETQIEPAGQSGAEIVAGTVPQGAGRPPGSRLVQVAHKSIRDYLSLSQSGWFPHAEARMAAICRVYKQSYDESEAKQGFAFENYVRNHWGYHNSKSDLEVSEAPTNLDIDAQIVRQASFPLAARQANHEFGLRQLALELEGMRHSLLMWACCENRMNVVDILLVNNIDWYQKPIARFIRENGAEKGCGFAWCSVYGGAQDIYPCDLDPLEPSDCSQDVCTKAISDKRIISAAVVAAASQGRIPIADALIGYGASIAGRDEDGFTALGVAALNGHSDMLGWLLGLDIMDAKALLELQPRLTLQLDASGRKWTLWTPPWGAQLRLLQVGTKRKVPGEKPYGRVAMTPLAAAAFNGHEMCVSMLLECMQKRYHEAPTALWKSSCMNAILCAIQGGHMAAMRLLLPFIDINSPASGFNGYTLLHFAILMQNAEAARVILAAKAVDLSVEDINGRTALAMAARVGADDLIRELWGRGAARVDPLAVSEALLEGHDTSFDLLCKLFLDCNPAGLFAADRSGYSCFDRLMVNCIREMAHSSPRGTPEAESHIDIEKLNAFNWTPMSVKGPWTISVFYSQIFSRLANKLLDRDSSPFFDKAGNSDGEYSFGVNSLLLALTSNSYELLRALLQLCPASVCDIRSEGGTILMAAFVKGSPKSIDLVLKTLKEQNDTTVVNSVSTSRHSALTAAIWIGRIDHEAQFRSLLRFRGFDLRLAFHQDEKGNCPLMTLALLTADHATLPLGQSKADQLHGTVETCETLYENCWQLFEALSDSLDRQELSNLFLRLYEGLLKRTGTRFTEVLCSMPRAGCLKLFLQSCPDLTSQLHTPNAKGRSPLMLASEVWRHNETIKFLLKTSEVDVDHRDEQGRTALSHVAINLGQFSDGGVASMLIEEYGQDPLAVDNRGWSPLCYAVSNGNVWEGSPYQRLLGDADTPMDWTDEQGSNPLHMAIKGGSPLAIKLLLQHPSSSSWLNVADGDGLVPLAHFFMDPRTSKYMRYYRLRHPHSGPIRKTISIDDSLKYHHEAKEVLQMMLARPDILPDIPDKESKTPLWHALDAVRKEYAAFKSKPQTGPRDGGQFDGFLRSSIEALCSRDDVDPLQPTGDGKTPLELATELVQTYNGVKSQDAVLQGDGGISPSATGGSSARAEIRAMIKGLSPMLPKPGARVLPPGARPRPRPRPKRYKTSRGLADAND